MSEIRVNRVVNAEGSNAPSFPYGFELPAGIGITGSGGVNVGGPSTIASSGGITTCGGDLFAGDSLGVLKDIKIGAAATIGGALGVTGQITGNVTGNLTGTADVATSVTVADESSDTSCNVVFTTAATGNLAPKSGTNLTFNSSSGALTATSVNGNIVGGTVSGTTGTFSGAVNVDDTTDSTSITSGSLIVDGGLGVAKNVYIGAGLSVAGTLTYEDVTSVDSVGLITAKSGVNVTGGQLTVGVAYSVGAAGVCTAAGFVGNLTGNASGSALNVTQAAQTAITSLGTLTGLTVSGDVLFDNGEDAGKDLLWDVSQDALIHKDSVYSSWGTDQDMSIWFDGSNSYMQNTTGNLYIRPKSSEDGIRLVPDAQVDLYYNNSARLSTTNEGVNVSGMMSATAGIGITGGMFEGCYITAGKLSDNTNIDIADGNIWHYTTTETTTCTPNIRWNSTYSLANKVRAGSVVTLNVITTAAAAGYCANWTIDGSAVTEEWNGGSAPTAGGSGGYDVYTHTIIHKPGGSWLVLSNVSNFA